MNDIINPKDIGIVIQGPTNYSKDILDNLDYRFNYVWSTWSDEPMPNLEEINKKIRLVINVKPPFAGLRNINLQCISSEEGIKALSTPWVVKIRSDLLWSGQYQLIQKAFQDIANKNAFASFLNYKPSIQEIHDFVTFSSRENALKLWSYRQKGHNDFSPEKQLAMHLIDLFNTDYDGMINHMTFCNVLMEENELDLYSLKFNVSLGNQCNTNLFNVPTFPKKYE